MGRRYQADTDFQHTINEINKHKHLYLLPPVLTQKTQGVLGEDKARSKGEESITLYRNYFGHHSLGWREGQAKRPTAIGQ
jgi:hypothetical protein